VADAPGVVRVSGPGADVLRAVMAELPQWTLSANGLRDQAVTVDGLLASGFTPAEVRHAFAHRPLPNPLTHTVDAVAAGRLRALFERGPRSAAPQIPAQSGSGDSFGDDQDHREHGGRRGEVVSAPAPLTEKMAAIEAAVSGKGALRFCPEDGGTCPNLVAPGEDKCPEHLDWPMCAVCGQRKRGARRMRPGATSCGHCATAAGPASDAEATRAPADADADDLAAQLAEAARVVEQAERDAYWGSEQWRADAQPREAPF
jgi:hypothetical protein